MPPSPSTLSMRYFPTTWPISSSLKPLLLLIPHSPLGAAPSQGGEGGRAMHECPTWQRCPLRRARVGGVSFEPGLAEALNGSGADRRTWVNNRYFGVTRASTPPPPPN